MGISAIISKFEEHFISKYKKGYKDLRWLELGNQLMWTGEAAKHYYEKKGVIHVSLDLNGKDGALPIDFGQPLEGTLGEFDVITDYGTLEHVNEQYQALKNIHVCARNNALIFHVVPKIGHWKGHGRYYYHNDFFEHLAQKCNYQLIASELLTSAHYEKGKHMVAVVMRKTAQSSFLSQSAFNALPGVQDTENLARTGNYSH